MTTPEPTATLVINVTSSYCGNCRQPVMPQATHHTDVCGWTPSPVADAGPGSSTRTPTTCRSRTTTFGAFAPTCPPAAPPPPPLLPGDPGPTTETHMQIDRTADTVRVTLTAEEAEAVQGDLGQIWANKISAAGDQLHSLLETVTEPA
ncbi:hypothetical protein [Streptomyces microflavus]|uniref:hypothetical protein n=1 Tax=Streptomyces microflavus TaxID=1919 RepID=UPI003B218247